LAAQREYLKVLDGYIAGMFEATGGPEEILEEYAVIVLSDHGHTPLLPGRRRYVQLGNILGEEGAATGARARFGSGSRVVVVPNGRSALIYLADGVRREEVASLALTRRGVDLAAWWEDGWSVVRRMGRELRFRPQEGVGDGFRDVSGRDGSGRGWDLRGDGGALQLNVEEGGIRYGEYPDALERLWGCLCSSRCGDVLLSATPGYTFGEVSGKFHDRSDHGSLHASDSDVFVLASGLSGTVRVPRRITEVAPTLLAHFGADGDTELRVP
jgi:hypothetical protein